MRVEFYKFDEICDDQLRFAVIMARHEGKWIMVRHKERTTWEIPGGHREEGEVISDTAARELMEETGSVDFELTPVAVYCVVKEMDSESDYTRSYGALYLAEVKLLGQLPPMEIAETALFDRLPDNMTYAAIQPHLYDYVCKWNKGEGNEEESIR